MSAIVTRAGKGSPLTHDEMDANFTNLNSDKLEVSALAPYETSAHATATYETIANAATTYATKTELNTLLPTQTGQGGKVLGTNGSTLAWTTISGGSGAVTSVSVSSANGLAGTVSNPTTTPAITLSTTITGVLKGNGTAISSAVAGTDYVAPGSATTSGLTMSTARLLGRTTASSGAIEAISVGSGLSLSGGTLAATGSSSYVGERAQVFTSSGTFTIPTGVTAVKVTVVGGGGGGASVSTGTYGGGGGGGGVAVKNITGLTPGGTVSVTVGGGGAASAAGGTSSFGAYCSATGGAAGGTIGVFAVGAAGGVGSGGDLNITGGLGNAVTAGGNHGGAPGGDAYSITDLTTVLYVRGTGMFGGKGGVGAAVANSNGGAATGYGCGGGGAWRASGSWAGGAGSGGLVIVEW